MLRLEWKNISGLHRASVGKMFGMNWNANLPQVMFQNTVMCPETFGHSVLLYLVRLVIGIVDDM